MDNMFVLGFDPIFLDIIASPLDDLDNKLEKLPNIGEHVSNTTIDMIPGGNALNVAKVLCKFSSKVYFYCSANEFFLKLVKKDIPDLNCIITSQKGFNITLALQFKSGEVQMNSISHFFSISDLTLDSLVHLAFSKIVPFSNIGLNAEGIALFDFFVLFFSNLNNFINNSSFNDDYKNITKFISSSGLFDKFFDVLNPNLNTLKFLNLSSLKIELSEKIFYFDPSTVTSFTSWTWLNNFFSSKFASLPGYKILSLNEHEFEIMIQKAIDFNNFLSKDPHNFLIVHESTKVSIFHNSIASQKILNVPSLDKEEIVLSVGAGDAFNAGLLFELSNSLNIIKACKFGISTAQKYITNSL